MQYGGIGKKLLRSYILKATDSYLFEWRKKDQSWGGFEQTIFLPKYLALRKY